jgi:peroxiredoxin
MMMKLKPTFLPFLLGILFCSYTNSDLEILSKTNKKLQELTTVQYKAAFKNYNPMTGELMKSDSAIALYDFKNNDKIIGAQYLFAKKSSDIGFNGLTSFFTNKEKKQLIYSSVKSPDDLFGMPFNMFSIQQLRNLMPQMLSDTAVQFNRLSDTFINGTACYKFNILMRGKGIDMNGKIVQRKNSNRSYSIMIGKKDYLPRQFISYFEEDSPAWIISYNNLDLSPAINDSLFDYSLRNSEYKKYTQDEYKIVSTNGNILKDNAYKGKIALNWTLPSMTGDSVTLSQIDANLVMLEFWFPYCTGCVAATRDINEIQKKYKNRGLQVFGVEFTKPDSTKLTDYISKMKIEYPILYAAKKVASNYGVSSGPTIFIINKAGKFVYARTGFIKEEVINAIESNTK